MSPCPSSSRLPSTPAAWCSSGREEVPEVGVLRRHGFAAGTLLAGCLACVPDGPVRGHLPLLLSELACRDEMVTALAEWGIGREALVGPPGPDETSTYRIPTGVLGDWIVLEARRGAPRRLMRVTPVRRAERLVDGRCRVGRPVVREVERVTPSPHAFTDARLDSILAEASPAGVIVYVWAPHMPLSVDGYAEADAAGRKLGLRVVPVLFAESDRDFALREARRAGIPEDGLREVDSVELLMRDAQVHAPSILVFARGRVSPVLPGYRDAEGYVRYIEGFLDAEPR